MSKRKEPLFPDLACVLDFGTPTCKAGAGYDCKYDKEQGYGCKHFSDYICLLGMRRFIEVALETQKTATTNPETPQNLVEVLRSQKLI